MSTLPLISLTTLFFFFNDTATTEIYTLSLHDALPISLERGDLVRWRHDLHGIADPALRVEPEVRRRLRARSEEHTSELQSRLHLVCRLLLEKKKYTPMRPQHPAIRHQRCSPRSVRHAD